MIFNFSLNLSSLFQNLSIQTESEISRDSSFHRLQGAVINGIIYIHWRTLFCTLKFLKIVQKKVDGKKRAFGAKMGHSLISDKNLDTVVILPAHRQTSPRYKLEKPAQFEGTRSLAGCSLTVSTVLRVLLIKNIKNLNGRRTKKKFLYFV